MISNDCTFCSRNLGIFFKSKAKVFLCFNKFKEGIRCNNRFSYKTVVIAITLFSAFFSTIGVESIIKFAVPLLVTLYPVAIVLIVLSIFDNLIPNRGVYIGAVYGALFISLFDALAAMGITIKEVQSMIAMLPFAGQGFSWLLPAVLGATIGLMMFKKVGAEGQR